MIEFSPVKKLIYLAIGDLVQNKETASMTLAIMALMAS